MTLIILSILFKLSWSHFHGASHRDYFLLVCIICSSRSTKVRAPSRATISDSKAEVSPPVSFTSHGGKPPKLHPKSSHLLWERRLCLFHSPVETTTSMGIAAELPTGTFVCGIPGEPFRIGHSVDQSLKQATRGLRPPGPDKATPTRDSRPLRHGTAILPSPYPWASRR